MLFKKTRQHTRKKTAARFFNSFERLETRNMLAAVFSSFEVTDGSLDNTPATTFESSSLAVSYDLDVTGGTLTNVQVFANQASQTFKIGEFSAEAVSQGLISLNGFASLVGAQNIFAVAQISDGTIATSSAVSIDVLPTSFDTGDYQANTFSHAVTGDSAFVYRGRGGTDTLDLNVALSAVADFNGAPLMDYDSSVPVSAQSFFAGSVFDYLTLDNGDEIYLQGIERLEFTGGDVVELTVRPDDSAYHLQWEHSIGDVSDAWKFTRGSDEVLIVSLDTGTQTSSGTPIYSDDLDSARHDFVLTNPNKSYGDGTHGHASVSIMSATGDNALGIAGVNQVSPILVTDVYNGIGNFSINDAIALAQDRIENTSVQRVVFQGGIQGEYWLQNSSLDQDLLAEFEETMLFAVAAGNGGQDISLTTNPVYSGGVARLEADFENVMAIGALQASKQQIHGLANATSLNLAGYSNYGENLTFAVSTNTPYVGIDNSVGTFSGTSNANPVMAGFSSLVWSANIDLTAGQVRQIFADTVMDIGAAGRDTTYGWGTPDAGSAVRRAWALSQNPELANLAVNPFAAGGDGVTSVVDDDSGNNVVPENATIGTALGITAVASDPNGDAVSYALLDDAGGLFDIDAQSGVVSVAGQLDFETATSHQVMVLAESADGSAALAEFSIAITNVNDAVVHDHGLLYLSSSFDSGSMTSLASDKAALGVGQTATFDNLSSFELGINGLVMDVQDFNQVPTLATIDQFFEFRVGNDDTPDDWSQAPLPTALIYEENVDGTTIDRIYFQWDDNAIENTWLEIKTLANSATGMPLESDAYFGNAIGESGNDPDNAIVNLLDVAITRENQTGFGTAEIDNRYDFNRDGKVNLLDVAIARSNQSGFTPLNLITPGGSSGKGFGGKPTGGKV